MLMKQNNDDESNITSLLNLHCILYPYVEKMQSVGSLKSSFAGSVNAFQAKSSNAAPKRGQLQVSKNT